jgi:hypothetical protein
MNSIMSELGLDGRKQRAGGSFLLQVPLLRRSKTMRQIKDAGRQGS